MKWNRSTETTLLLISMSATDESKFPDTKKIGPDKKLAISVTNRSWTARGIWCSYRAITTLSCDVILHYEYGAMYCSHCYAFISFILSRQY